MRRGNVTHIISAALGAALWAAALLLPQTQDAKAQLASAPYHQLSTPANPVAAAVREVVSEQADPDRELECLALNVYFEARGEPLAGKYAVAAVTLNRVAHPNFPESICDVVRQGVQLGHHRCQFSWACDRNGDRPRDAVAWEHSKEVAYGALYRDEPDPTAGALYFHTTRVHPSWSRTMVKVGRIGAHYYYREPHSVQEDVARSRS
jgi:N-acetylmuramoyl-L-alanine amidase